MCTNVHSARCAAVHLSRMKKRSSVAWCALATREAGQSHAHYVGHK